MKAERRERRMPKTNKRMTFKLCQRTWKH